MNYVFPPAPPVAVQVLGGGAVFPVRRVYCVGQNYADHVAEMGNDGREPPVFFSKPADALVPGGGDIALPPMTENYHHEVELVIAIGLGGQDIPVDQALEHVFGYAVGFDLTRRDLQAQAKKKGQPWETGKGADQSAPISAIRPVAQGPHPDHGAIWLKVNGEGRQQGDLSQMIWSAAEIIANLSGYFRLAPGDLIFTGTPAGVSALKRGDVVEGGIDGIGELKVRIE